LLNRLNRVPGQPRGFRLRSLFTQRYRVLQRVKENDSQGYETRLKRFTLEDEIWDLGRQLRDAADTSREQELRQQLRGKIAEWLDMGTAERRERIRRMEKTLETEKQELARDQSQREEIIQRRLRQAMNEGTGLGEDRPGPPAAATQPSVADNARSATTQSSTAQ
jgi:hypothetical protein